MDGFDAGQLHGSVAVITGGTGKLGEHLARALAHLGASIVVPHLKSRDVHQETVASLQMACAESGASFKAVQADLTTATGVAKTFEAADQLGGCNILINGASMFSRRSLESTNSEDVQAMTAINVEAPLNCTRVAVAQMKRRGGGTVVNILDVGGGLIPWKTGATYCATRAALAMATQCLARELFDDNIFVTGIAIGLTTLSPEASDPNSLARQRIPMGRPATIDEVIHVLKLILSKEIGPSLSGNILAVDGGRSVLHEQVSR